MRLAFSSRAVRKGSRLRIFVEKLQIGTRRSGVQIVVILLDVLAVIPFPIGEAEKPFLQDADLFRSRSPERNRCAGAGRRIRRCHLPPSDSARNASGRAGNNPRHRHWRCNLRERCPIAARQGTDPSVSNGLPAQAAGLEPLDLRRSSRRIMYHLLSAAPGRG